MQNFNAKSAIYRFFLTTPVWELFTSPAPPTGLLPPFKLCPFPPPPPPPFHFPMEPSGSLILPSPADLTPHQLTFLKDSFTSAQHLLSTSSDLSSQLAKACSDRDRELVSLRKKLVKLTVSWIYRSIVAKSSIQNASVKLENLCLLTSSPREFFFFCFW